MHIDRACTHSNLHPLEVSGVGTLEMSWAVVENLMRLLVNLDGVLGKLGAILDQDKFILSGPILGT